MIHVSYPWNTPEQKAILATAREIMPLVSSIFNSLPESRKTEATIYLKELFEKIEKCLDSEMTEDKWAELLGIQESMKDFRKKFPRIDLVSLSLSDLITEMLSSPSQAIIGIVRSRVFTGFPDNKSLVTELCDKNKELMLKLLCP